MPDAQSPGEVLEALFSFLEAVEEYAPNVGPAEYHMAAAALGAFEATGALDDAAVAPWRERLEREGERVTQFPGVQEFMERITTDVPAPAASDAMRRRASELMQRLVGQVAQTREMSRSSDQDYRFVTIAHANGALEALKLAGLVDQGEAQRWAGQLAEAAELRAPGPRAIRVPGQRPASVAAVARRPAPPPQPVSRRIEALAPAFRGDRLRRVMQLDVDDATTIKPYLIEFYEDGVITHHTMPWERDSQHPLAASRIELEDDLETAYASRGGNGGSLGNRLTYQQVFSPAVPEAATQLKLTIEADVWVIDLPDDRQSRR